MSYKQFVCRECSESCYILVPHTNLPGGGCGCYAPNWEELEGLECVTVVPVTTHHRHMDEVVDEVFDTWEEK